MSRNIWKLGKEFTDQVSAISYGVIKNHFYDKWLQRKSLLELTINFDEHRLQFFQKFNLPVKQVKNRIH